MHINSLNLMYQTFQSCRLTQPLTGTYLSVLAQALPLIQQEQRYIISLPRNVIRPILDTFHFPVQAFWWHRFNQRDRVELTAQPFLNIIVVVIPELQHLWASQQLAPTRALGYAFHNMHQFVRRPERFDPEDYLYSIHRVYLRWQPSPLLQAHFAHLLKRTPEELSMLLERKEPEI